MEGKRYVQQGQVQYAPCGAADQLEPVDDEVLVLNCGKNATMGLDGCTLKVTGETN